MIDFFIQCAILYMSDINGLWVEIVKKIFFAVRRGQGMDSALFCCLR